MAPAKAKAVPTDGKVTGFAAGEEGFELDVLIKSAILFSPLLIVTVVIGKDALLVFRNLLTKGEVRGVSGLGQLAIRPSQLDVLRALRLHACALTGHAPINLVHRHACATLTLFAAPPITARAETSAGLVLSNPLDADCKLTHKSVRCSRPSLHAQRRPISAGTSSRRLCPGGSRRRGRELPERLRPGRMPAPPP